MNSIALHEIEDRFQRLRANLQTVQSERIQLRLLVQFLETLHGRSNPQQSRSYYLELIGFLIYLVQIPNLQFRPMSQLKHLSRALEEIHLLGIGTHRKVELKTVHTRIQTAHACLFLYRGAWRRALVLLGIKTAGDLKTFQGTFSVKTDLEKVYQKIKDIGIGDVSHNALREIWQEWRQNAHDPANTEIWVPMIERCEGLDGEPIIDGTLQKLRVQAEIRMGSHRENQLIFNHYPIGYDDPIYSQAADAVSVARNQLKSLPFEKLPWFRIMFGYLNHQASYTGTSFGLAMACGALASMETVMNQRIRHCPKPEVAFTGGLDRSGAIRPISSESLRVKLLAVQNSPLQKLVVPTRNQLSKEQDIAESAILIAKSTLSQTYLDKSITSRIKVPVNIWIQSHIRRIFKKDILILVFPLLVILTLLVTILIDNNPVEVDIQKDRLLVRNGSGRLLWSYRFGSELDREKYINSGKALNFFERLLVDDFDRDGTNEVIIGISEMDHPNTGKIFYFQSSGELSWTYAWQPGITFGENQYGDQYLVQKLLPLRTSARAIEDFIVDYVHIPWFPGALVRLSAVGAIEGVYWNAGHIKNFEYFDVGGNGSIEIVAVGTNNDYDTAILLVLDPDRLVGHSPQDTSAYIPRGVPPGQEIYYLRFPPLEPYNFFQNQGRLDIGSLRIYGNDKLVATVDSREFSLLYTFDNELNLLDFGFSDGFADQYKKNTGRNYYTSAIQDSVTAHFRSVEYWDGDTWVLEPTRNKYYSFETDSSER